MYLSLIIYYILYYLLISIFIYAVIGKKSQNLIIFFLIYRITEILRALSLLDMRV